MPEKTDKTKAEMAGENKLLTVQERQACEQIAAGNAPHSQRAQLLLALDEGASQPEAGSRAGLTIGQVRYWLGRFRQRRMEIFPADELELASAQPVAVPSAAASFDESLDKAAKTSKKKAKKKKKSKKAKGQQAESKKVEGKTSKKKSKKTKGQKARVKQKGKKSKTKKAEKKAKKGESHDPSQA